MTHQASPLACVHTRESVLMFESLHALHVALNLWLVVLFFLISLQIDNLAAVYCTLLHGSAWYRRRVLQGTAGYCRVDWQLKEKGRGAAFY